MDTFFQGVVATWDQDHRIYDITDITSFNFGIEIHLKTEVMALYCEGSKGQASNGNDFLLSL